MKKTTWRSWLRGEAVTKSLLKLGLIFWIGSASIRVCASEGEATMTAITHAGVTINISDRRSLRSFFSLRTRTWPDGTAVRVFAFEDQDPRHAAFCKSVLGTYPYILRRAWDRNLFAGTGLVPEIVTDEEEMMRKVSHTPGAIGYISSKNAATKRADARKRSKQ